MSEETIQQGGWSEGGPVESMSPDQAKSEISAIESGPDFLGTGKLDHWSRQNMLKRRDALYKRSLGEAGEKPYNFMGEVLQKQGVTEEGLKKAHEGFEDRDHQEIRRKAMDALSLQFGGEEQAKEAISEAKGLLRRFAKPADFKFLNETGLGNSPELIQKLAEISRLLKKGGKK